MTVIKGYMERVHDVESMLPTPENRVRAKLFALAAAVEWYTPTTSPFEWLDEAQDLSDIWQDEEAQEESYTIPYILDTYPNYN
jgi:hypothetical protein